MCSFYFMLLLYYIIFSIIQAPRHCSYVQRVLYNYSFYDDDYPSDVKQYGPISDTEFHFEGFIEKIGNYQLQLTIGNKTFNLITLQLLNISVSNSFYVIVFFSL